MPRSEKNNERTERAPRSNRNLTKVEPLHPQAQTIDKSYVDLAKFPSENPYPVMRIHKNGTILYANKASEPLLKAQNSAVGLPAPPEWRRPVKKALSSGKVIREEIKLDRRVFGFEVVPITDNDYANYYRVDITEQKLEREKLENERNLLRTLIDHIPGGIYIKDKNGRFLACNKSLAELWNVRGKDNIIGKTDLDLFKPELAQLYFDEEQKIIQTGQPIVNKEAECTDKSGNPNFLLVTKVPLLDSAGNITGLVGIHRDITERKKNEETILRLNRILTMIADISQHILLIQDKDLLLRKICEVIVRHAYRMAWIGFCDENSKMIVPQAQAGFEEGYLASIKVTFDDTEHGMGPCGMAVKTAKPNIMRFIATDPRFEPWRTEAIKRGYYSSAAIPIVGEDTVIGVMSMYADKEDAFDQQEIKLLEELSRDISTGLRSIDEQTRRHQAEQKLSEYQKHLKRLAAQLTLVEEQERRRIAREIHDEISQTLAMTKIKLDALRSSPPSETSAAMLEEINSLIKKVIQETRTLTFELSNPILYELGFELAVAEWLNENVQEKHGIATEFHDDGLPKPLDDDLKAMLFRNTRELLTNCIKHAKAGKIMVGLRRIDDSIEVTVEDNGVGFDPVQIRTTTGKKTKFGLFSIRENMENTGGSFEIQSKPGAGCKAIMIAPLKDQSNKKET
jgi:PAS domain S-box-containing protein